jgi:hypothetical protein
MRLACSLCGSVEGSDTSWRWDGKAWQHMCPRRQPEVKGTK